MAMALRAGNLFHFLFSVDDQNAIDETTLTLEDAPYAAAPAAGQPYPQSLKIRFRMKDPAQPAPRLRPLAPGLLTFLRDPPDGSDTATGTLLLKVVHDKVVQRMRDVSALPVVPSLVWYSKVALTRAFLSTWLPALPAVTVLPGRTGRLEHGTPPWIAAAIPAFLSGTYTPALVAGANAADDTVATVPMPPLVKGADGWITLVISAAYDAPPFDGEYKDYEVADGVAETDPAHPRNGAVPARLVYRALGSHPTLGSMAGAENPRQPVAARILDEQPIYYPIRFTRVWKPVEEQSVYLPSQVVRCAQPVQGGLDFRQRLPAHGVLFVPLAPAQQLAGPFTLTLRTPSGDPKRWMRWLVSEAPPAWRETAYEEDLPPLDLTQQPHILLRRRMGQEVIYDRYEDDRIKAHGLRCTYFSMRRAVRAIINNRIAGGRLNFEVYFRYSRMNGANSSATKALVREAIGAVAQHVLDGAPIFDGPIGQEAERLYFVLRVLAPAEVVLQPPPGLDPGHYPVGEAAYFLWQSALDAFSLNPSRRAYDPEWLAGGGPGALVALGEAAGYVVNPATAPSPPDTPGATLHRERRNGALESDVELRERNVDAMLAGDLEPGAALQFWQTFAGMDYVRTRHPHDPAHPDPVGHSPTFLRYSTDPNGEINGMWVLDQQGVPTHCPILIRDGRRLLDWSGFLPQAWIAANWSE